MKRKRLLFLIGGLIVACLPVAAAAASTSISATNYFLARVEKVTPPGPIDPQLVLRVDMLNGSHSGQVINVPATGVNSSSDITLPTYKVDDIVVVSATEVPQLPTQYSVIDHFRVPDLIVLLAIVIFLAIIFAGWRGAGSIVGLAISLAVIGGFIIPNILAGHNAYEYTLIGCFAISALGIYFAHGFSRRTFIAMISTYITLIVAAIASLIAVIAANLNGIASEDASYVHQQMPFISTQGILLAGIMIGVLGVLDDITVGQASAVEEIHLANANLDWKQVYRRGLHVGREHISSLINTLVLAYVGSSLIYVIFVVSVLNLPIWLTLNSELVSEEIVRSLVGSFALILAVPIATVLSAYFLVHHAPHRKRRGEAGGGRTN